MTKFGGGETKACHCGKDFVQQNARQKYCSLKCKRKHDMAVRYRPPAPAPTCGCAYCGELVPKGRHKFCSAACSYAHVNAGKPVRVVELPVALPATVVRLGMFGI